MPLNTGVGRQKIGIRIGERGWCAGNRIKAAANARRTQNDSRQLVKATRKQCMSVSLREHALCGAKGDLK
jgi:hypothetical protein